MTVDEASQHPRPLLRRPSWRSLDGTWDFAFEDHPIWADPRDVRWDRRIRVPFAPETPASGIHDTGFHDVCWYRRWIEPPELGHGERLILRFNAVDHEAKVWANDRLVARHEGGYTPFAADITGCAAGGEPFAIVVRALDDPHDLAKPRGKQDWQLDPHSIWYPRTSGIWQTVWIERLPPTAIGSVRWTSNLERWEIGLEVHLNGECRGEYRLRVVLEHEGKKIAEDVYSIVNHEVNRRIGLSDPGIDDYRNELLWSPHSPVVIEARLELIDAHDEVVDAVQSYTALRSIAVQGHSIVLNGRPYPLRMVLDQGYWPETGMTAPDTDALRRDVELAKAMGFNGVRKHQKIEDPRYLYWADRLGLLVTVEMPSAYRFTTTATARLTREWIDVIERDVSHPCVVAWVPFNESWGVPNLPDMPAQRHFVEALYHLTRTIDPTRLVIGNDGWESGATDVVGIHDYDDQPARIGRRYRGHEDIPHLFRRERPGGRMLILDSSGTHETKPIVLSEFGGIALCMDEDSGCWGYSTARSPEELARRYDALLQVVRGLPALAGFCYTQFADTYQEANGLLFADRTPKFPLDQMADSTRGPRLPRLSAAAAERRDELEKRAERGEPGVQHDEAAP